MPEFPVGFSFSSSYAPTTHSGSALALCLPQLRRQLRNFTIGKSAWKNLFRLGPEQLACGPSRRCLLEVAGCAGRHLGPVPFLHATLQGESCKTNPAKSRCDMSNEDAQLARPWACKFSCRMLPRGAIDEACSQRSWRPFLPPVVAVYMQQNSQKLSCGTCYDLLEIQSRKLLRQPTRDPGWNASTGIKRIQEVVSTADCSASKPLEFECKTRAPTFGTTPRKVLQMRI